MSVKPSSSVVETLSDSKTAILDAALIEFSEWGLEGTSVRKIGKRAKVDFTLITYYFKTKENLWKAVFSRGLEQYREIIHWHMSNAKEQSPGQQLRARMAGEMAFAYSEASMFRMVANIHTQRSSLAQWVKEHFINAETVSAISLIKAAQASGEVVQGDPDILLKMMQVAVRSLLIFRSEHLPHMPDNKTQQTLWQIFEQVFFKAIQ